MIRVVAALFESHQKGSFLRVRKTPACPFCSQQVREEKETEEKMGD